jgi:protein gp37
MAETTGIEWADSTLNIWEGCQETGSPACVGCYAKARNLRFAPKGSAEAPNWGPHAPRREVKSWRATLRRISRKALQERPGGRWLVFVNSLSDFWDNKADPRLRAEALAEFRKHPHLTLLLLTKRPQNIAKMARDMAAADLGVYADDMGLRSWWPRNVAIGCTVVTQAEADRDIPWLLDAKALLRPAFAFLSLEPLAEIVDLRRVGRTGPMSWWDVLRGEKAEGYEPGRGTPRIDWVITGGCTDQGKHRAYPTPFDGFRRVRDDCAAAGVPYLHKQNGEFEEAPAGVFPMAFPAAGVAPDLHLFTTQRFGGLTRITGEVRRVGKKAAGRLLDGVEHNGMPEAAHG